MKSNKTEFSMKKIGLWFTLCNVIQRGIQFLVTPIYARLVSTDGYGRYSTFLTWANLFSVIVTLSLASGIFNKAMSKYSDNHDDYVTSMIGLCTASTGVSAIVFFLFYPLLKDIIQMDFVQCVLLFVCVYFQMIYLLNMGKWRYEYNIFTVLIYTVVYAVLIPFIGLILYAFVFKNEQGLVWGFVLANVIVGIILIIVSLYKSRKLYNREYWNYALKFNLPLVPHYLSSIVLGQSDRIMIKYYCDDTATGLYTLAYQVSLIMNILATGIDNAITPWIYENIEKSNYEVIKKRTNDLIMLCIVPFVMIMLAAPEFVFIMGSKEFYEAIYVIPPVVVASYFMFANTFVVRILFYYERSTNVMVVTTVSAVVNVLLNYMLLMRFGYIAAAYTTEFGYFLILLLNALYLKIKLKEFWNNMFSGILLLISSIIIMVSSILSLGLYQLQWWIRWGVLLVFMVIIVIKRDKISEYVRNK